LSLAGILSSPLGALFPKAVGLFLCFYQEQTMLKIAMSPVVAISFALASMLAGGSAFAQ
jgi:preprotein translocase subunit Sec61beta